MRRSRWGALAPLMALALVAGGCASDTGTVTPGPVVSTQYETGADFSAFKTFAIVDKVGLVTNDGLPGIKWVDAPALIAEVTNQLVARNFQRVAVIDPLAPPTTPVAAQLSVNISALETVQKVGGFWIGYGGYWDPSYWGHVHTPPATWQYPWTWLPITFTTGTVLIEIADLTHALPPEGILPTRFVVKWAATCLSVSTSLTGYDDPQVLAAVDQAFAQSPYVRTTP